jgi:hypothetical protein
MEFVTFKSIWFFALFAEDQEIRQDLICYPWVVIFEYIIVSEYYNISVVEFLCDVGKTSKHFSTNFTCTVLGVQEKDFNLSFII